MEDSGHHIQPEDLHESHTNESLPTSMPSSAFSSSSNAVRINLSDLRQYNGGGGYELAFQCSLSLLPRIERVSF